jgi:hypothetical protein
VGDKWIGDPRNTYEVVEDQMALTDSDEDQASEPLEKVVEDIKEDVKDKAEEARIVSEALEESRDEVAAEPKAVEVAT